MWRIEMLYVQVFKRRGVTTWMRFADFFKEFYKYSLTFPKTLTFTYLCDQHFEVRRKAVEYTFFYVLN